MAFSRFHLQIAGRAVLLALTLVLGAALIVNEFLITAGLFGILAVIQIVLLIRYVAGTERELSRFL